MHPGAFPRRHLYLTRVVLCALLAALIALSVISVRLYAQSTTTAMEAEVLRSMQLSVRQAKSNLDYRLQQTADSARTLLGTVYPYLNSNAGLEAQLAEYSNMNRVLNEYVGKYMIFRARLFAPAEKIYARQGETFHSLESLLQDEAFRALVGDRRGGVFWQETRPLSLGLSGSVSAISCVAVVSGSENYNRIVGALYLDIDVAQIGRVFSASSGEGNELYLINEGGVVIAHADSSRIGRIEFTRAQMDELRLGGGGTLSGEKLIACERIDTCDWYLIDEADRASVLRPGGPAAGILASMIAVTLLVALVLIMAIAYNMMLSRTVHTINQAISALEDENGTPDGAGRRGIDALSRLRNSAGKMVFAAQRIVEERYQNRLAVSEYQMQALQAQIKPHFLYNTLDVIKWMIADGDVENGVWMVNALSKYLRMSINRGPGAVTLHDEMTLTENYLGIMRRRFRNAFQVELELEREAMGCVLPRFLLQPLVENALLHGLLRVERPDRKLTIRAWLEAEQMLIEIEDNGCGMSEEVRLALETREVDDAAGYGVANVKKRLLIFGGAQASLKIASREGMGTCVSIALPARFGPEES